jgi:TolA-binding protein
MAASSSRNLTIEERLKQLDETLESLKQTLQYQLDFLENLDSEAGRRLEQLEQDISTVKIGFTEELGKLHQELKSPKDEFEERIGQLEGKMSKLNIEWGKDPKE